MRIACLATLCVITVGASARLCAEDTSRALRVTVTYSGAGTVDEGHQLFVQIFNTSYIGHEGIMPIASSSLSRNGETAAFAELPASPVYVAVFYDQRGACSNGCDEPPSGSPAALYGAQAGVADPIDINAGETRAIRVVFDDSITIP
jgi:hypothetical protein